MFELWNAFVLFHFLFINSLSLAPKIQFIFQYRMCKKNKKMSFGVSESEITQTHLWSLIHRDFYHKKRVIHFLSIILYCFKTCKHFKALILGISK